MIPRKPSIYKDFRVSQTPIVLYSVRGDDIHVF